MAIDITSITDKVGAKPNRKRVGRGESSGLGKTCGRGNKGCGARAGYRSGDLYEGGMFPLFRRLPKFGFNNAEFRTEYQTVNLADLDSRFEAGARVTLVSLEEAGLVNDSRKRVKVLGDGQLTKNLTVEAHRFSASAASKIEAAGGTVTRLGPQPKKRFIKRPPPPKPEPAAQEQAGEGKKTKKKAAKPESAAEQESS